MFTVRITAGPRELGLTAATTVITRKPTSPPTVDPVTANSVIGLDQEPV